MNALISNLDEYSLHVLVDVFKIVFGKIEM